VLLTTTTAFAADTAPPETAAAEAELQDPQDALPPPDASGTFDMGLLCSRPLAPFAGALIGGALAGTTGLACIGVSAVTYTITAIFAIGGGGVLPLLLALASWGGLGGALCGYGPCSALSAGGGAAIAAELVDRRSLALMLGTVPGVLLGVVGAAMAGQAYMELGLIGFITQIFGTGLPQHLYWGVGLSTLAAPVAMGGAFAAAALFGDSLDEMVGDDVPPETVDGEIQQTPTTTSSAPPKRPATVMRRRPFDVVMAY